MLFKNKVVLITGGSAGIGAKTALRFAKEGADVAIVGRNLENLHKVADECAKVGNPALIIKADLSKEEEVKSVIQKTIEKYTKLDILVNNAAIFKISPMMSEDLLQSFDEVYNINLRAVVQLTQLAAPYLKISKGNIINLSSILGDRTVSYPEFVAYGAMKAALVHFSSFSALELAPFGVRVNTVSPGPVRTDFLYKAGYDQPLELFEKVCPLQTIADAEDVADVILFLAKAKSVTGSNYFVDNGLKIRS